MSNTRTINRTGVNDENPLSIVRRPATEDCNLQGTNWFLDPFPPLDIVLKLIGTIFSKEGLNVSPIN
jgi:hypothetical protein